MASYEAYLGVGIDASGAQAGANQFAGATGKMSAAAKKATQETARLQQQLNYAKLALTAFAAVALRQTIKTISEYGYSMAGLNAVTNATAADMIKLEAVTRKLGATTQFTASQAADAAKNLGMAGYNTNKIIESLPVTLDLAAAASIDMAAAASITTGVMAGFQLGADKARGAADILAAMASNAKVDISGMGEALKYVGPVANDLGISLGETSSALGVLANNGIVGGQAGRQLKAAIQALANPTKAAEAELAKLNLTVDDVNLRTHGLTKVMQTLSDAGMGVEEAFKIFNSTSATSMTILTKSVPEFQKLIDVATGADGTIKRMADMMRNTFKGSVDILWSALDELMLTLGDMGVTGAAVSLIKESTKLIDWLTSLTKSVRENKEQFKLFQDIILALGLTIAGMIAIKLAAWFYAVAAALVAATTAAIALNSALLLIGGGTVGVIACLVKLGVETQELEDLTQEQNNALLEMGGKYGDAARAGEIALTRLQLSTMRTTQQIKSDIDSLVQAAEQRDKMQNSRFPGGKPAGFSDPDTWSQIAGQTDTDLISRAVAELKKREDAEKKINDLLEKQTYLTATTNKETRARLKFAEDFAMSPFMNPLGLIPQAPKPLVDDDGTVSGSAAKKDPFMVGELRNMQLAVELAKNLGMAESELYRIRLNAQALQDARENGQKSISATTQKQIEQAVALKAEEDKLTTVYEARKGLDDNLKARLKTAMEAVSVAQNMGASEADLLRMTLESQASEAARKMGLQGINAEMQTMIDKLIALTSLAADYKKAYENDKASKDYLQSLQDQLAAEKQRGEFMQKYKGDIAEVDTQMQIYNESKRKDISLTEKQIAKAAELINEKKKLSAEESAAAEASKKAAESQKQWNNQLTYAFKDAIMNSKNLGDALSNLANRVQDMLVNKALDSLLGGMFASMKFAKGAAFQAGGVTAFASGGVVNSPTMFPMRGGVGMMGEAGAEAIMPLTRTSSGDLGVKAVGAGTVVNTSININVTGGTKEQNEDAGKRVSAAVRQAIDDTVVSVIMREKRPGGVLNAA